LGPNEKNEDPAQRIYISVIFSLKSKKKDYIAIEMNNIPSFESLCQDDDCSLLKKIDHKALEQAYELLTYLNGTDLQVATSESLTAGLIMSTLVQIPWAGWHKYGCFGVYDTDAKRVFNSVKVDDVYTHTCAKEMAIGILKNSNATLSIAVTGNAMPYYDNLSKLGEVFIGLAGYRKNDKNDKYEIVYSTKSINSCFDSEEFLNKCQEWLKLNFVEGVYAPRQKTATISLLIRSFTTYQALKECQEFIKSNELVSPTFISEQKKTNEKKMGDCWHTEIPAEKYPRNIDIICLTSRQQEGQRCNISESCKRLDTKEIDLDKIKMDSSNKSDTKEIHENCRGRAMKQEKERKERERNKTECLKKGEKCTYDFVGWGHRNYVLKDGECFNQCPICVNNICEEGSFEDWQRAREERGDLYCSDDSGCIAQYDKCSNYSSKKHYNDRNVGFEAQECVPFRRRQSRCQKCLGR